MNYNFTGERALVTGGSRGIGRGIVKALVAAGADVFAIGKSQQNLDKLKSEIPKVHIIAVDLANWEATELAVEKIGDIDFLVNNAATFDQFYNVTSFVHTPKAKLDFAIDVNLKAPFNVSQIVARNMIKRSCGGAIVNMSSVAGIVPLTGMSVYNISKAGLDMMTKTMALELGKFKIRVNTISPTVVYTESADVQIDQLNISPKYQKVIKSALHSHPLRKFAEIVDIVNATLFLLSDQSAMITGTILPVDGGVLVRSGGSKL